MITKPDDVITAYLTDSQNKEIVIDHEGKDYNSINYYIGDVTNNYVGWVNTLSANQNALLFSALKGTYEANFKPYVHSPIIDDWGYYMVYINFMLQSIPAGVSLRTDEFRFLVRFYYDEENPTYYQYFYQGYYPTVDLYSGHTFRIIIPRTHQYIDRVINAWKIEVILNFLDSTTVLGGEKVYWSMSSPRFYFSTDEYVDITWHPAPDFANLNKSDLAYTIDNHELLLQDFSITESLCSQDNIKFGLCEAAHCEFGCVTNDNPKVGDKITVVSKLPGSSAITDAQLRKINWSLRNPINGFTYTYNNYDPFFVNPICPGGMSDVMADWSHYVNLLNLKSRTMGIKYDLRLTFSNVTGTIPTYFKRIEDVIYNGTVTELEDTTYWNVSDYFFNFRSVFWTYNTTPGSSRVLEGYKRVRLKFYDANKNPYTFGDTKCTYVAETKNWQFVFSSGIVYPNYDRDDLMAANGTLDTYIYSLNNAIPLGIFYINSVSKKYRHNVIEKKIEAYDNMVVLEQNAADWYTSYMFGLDSDDWTSNGFEFARQIFSSYINYVMGIGLESTSRYIESEIAKYTYSQITSSYLSSKYKSWGSGLMIFKIRYAVFTVSNPDPTHLYMVKCTNTNGYSDDYIIQNYIGSYKTSVDSLGRGVCTNGGVLVEETRDNGTTAGFCINRGDYFMISPNCTSFKVYIAAQVLDSQNVVVNHLVDDVTIYEVESAPKLTNGYLRLCYYNYGTKDIFACNSSITGRDVVRSLLEVCGCFFRLSRFDGLPEFVYPTKGGLYPSNTLFPADDLYPRSGVDGVYPMGRYMSIIAENYQVKNYGRIQILKDSKSNEAVSVCEWQYEGDPDAENTYIIDDNIFYCADDMMYDYDNMPEVAQMLAGMWEVVSNLGYVPNTTEALGSPWIECGDRLGLLTYDGGIESFVFRRTLKGIQNLKDTYESVGDEYIEAIDNFGY